MNNKGQSLVLFILIIPIILLIFVLLIDVGRLILYKNEMDSINYLAMDYLIDNKNNQDVIDDTKKLILKNNNEFDNVNIEILNNKYFITIEDTFNGLIFDFDNIGINKITSKYIGYYNNNNVVIEKAK